MQECLLLGCVRNQDACCNQARVHRVFSRVDTLRKISSKKTTYVVFCD